jgi:anti-sigma-K factor RskA
MTKEEALDLIPLYAMGLLEKSEAQALEQFLAQAANSSLRAEFQRYQAMTDALPLMVKAVPAPDLREGLRQRLAEQRSAPTLPAMPKPALPFWKRREIWGAVAVLIVVLGLGIWLTLPDDSKPGKTDPTTVASKQIEAVLTDPNTRQVEISAAEEFASISGRLFIDNANEYGVLQLAGINPLPEEQAYQLWLMNADNERYDAGVFNSDTTHTVNYLVRLPDDFANYRAAGVTIEPATGSPDPTGALVLSASLED